MYTAQQSQINRADSGVGSNRQWSWGVGSETQRQMHRQVHSLEKPVENSEQNTKLARKRSRTQARRRARNLVRVAPRPEPSCSSCASLCSASPRVRRFSEAGCDSQRCLTGDFQVEIRGRSCLERRMLGGEVIQKASLISFPIPEKHGARRRVHGKYSTSICLDYLTEERQLFVFSLIEQK